MNLLKSSIAAAAATLVISLAVSAQAQDVTDGIYTFTATDSNDSLDGSWVEFSGDKIVNWDLVDPSQAAANVWVTSFFGSAYLNNFPPLTPANSAVVSLATTPTTGAFGPDAFNFSIASPWDATSSSDSQIWEFSADNNWNSSDLYDAITYNNPDVPDPSVNDPIGIWAYSTIADSQGALDSVPDVSDTFALLMGALTTLGTCKYMFRNRR